MSTLIKNGLRSLSQQIFVRMMRLHENITLGYISQIWNRWANWAELNVCPVERIVAHLRMSTSHKQVQPSLWNCTVAASLMIMAVLCLFCVDRLSRLSECIHQTLLQVWALTLCSDFQVWSIKTSKSSGFRCLWENNLFALSKTAFIFGRIVACFYTVSQCLGFKALLELVFILFSCQIILVTAFVNEILQMCVK